MRNLPIFGNATMGYYYVEAYIGTPEQKQTLILDTGSNLTIMPCVGCQQCRHHLNNNFDPNKSSSFKKIEQNSKFLNWKCKFFDDDQENCVFHQGYTEGSAYIGKQ
jgi:ferredoxin